MRESAATLSGLGIEPAEVKGGAVPQPLGTVSLSGPAQVDVTIALASSHPTVAEVPPAVTVPAGAAGAFFHVIVRPTAAPQAVVITATLDGARQAADLCINPLTEVSAVTGALGDGSVPSTSPAQPALPGAAPVPNGVSSGPHTTVLVPRRLDPLAPGGESFRAALVLATPALPMLATVIAVGLYIMPLNSGATWLAWVKANPLLVAVAISALLGLIAGGVLAWVTRATSADQANASLFGQIEARYRELEAHISVLSRRTDFSPTEQAAFDEAVAYAELIHRELCTAGGR